MSSRSCLHYKMFLFRPNRTPALPESTPAETALRALRAVSSSAASVPPSAECTESDVLNLRSLFKGSIIRRDDASFERRRKVFNACNDIQETPALIFRCVDEDDVSNAIVFAKKHGLHVSVRGGARSPAGFGTCGSDGIVIDLSPMRGYIVEAEQRVVIVQGGVTWGELVEQLAEKGLCTPGATSAEVGVAGTTLSGGYGWLSREFGLTVDNLESAVVVIADGTIVSTSETKNSDLFWAIRGGGSNFGVVTEFTYRLHPLKTITGGHLVWPITDLQAVLEVYNKWWRTTQPLSAVAHLSFSRQCQDRAVFNITLAYFFHGEPAAAFSDVKPFRDLRPSIDTVRELSYQESFSLRKGCSATDQRRHARSAYVSDRCLNFSFLEPLLRTSQGSYNVTFRFEHFGGFIDQHERNATAFVHRNDPAAKDVSMCLAIESSWMDASDDTVSTRYVDTTFDLFQPYLTGEVYQGYVSGKSRGHTQVVECYGSNLPRLVAIKRKWDKKNIFRTNITIPPFLTMNTLIMPSSPAGKEDQIRRLGK